MGDLRSGTEFGRRKTAFQGAEQDGSAKVLRYTEWAMGNRQVPGHWAAEAGIAGCGWKQMELRSGINSRKAVPTGAFGKTTRTLRANTCGTDNKWLWQKPG